jgi:hypothetical protein
MALTAPKKGCASIYCPACTVATSVNGQTRLTSTVAVAGIEQVLKHALAYFLTPEFVTAFRNSLELKLNGDGRHEMEACHSRLTQLRATQQRLSHMLAAVTEEDPLLEQRYQETREKVREAEKRLTMLEAGRMQVDARVVEAQQRANPAKLLEGIFEANIAPERLRVILARLFPQIVFEGKPSRAGKASRYTSFFRIRFAHGEALAVASETEVIIQGEMECRFSVRYVPSRVSKGGQPPRWTVNTLGTSNQSGMAATRTSLSAEQ